MIHPHLDLINAYILQRKNPPSTLDIAISVNTRSLDTWDLIFPEAEGRIWNEMSYGAQDTIAGVNNFSG